jgi:flagellar protein FlgJ
MQVDSASSQFALDLQGLQRLQHDAREKRPEALRAAAQQFEALFLHALIKGMRATVPTSDLTNSKQTEFYQSLLDHQWAQTMAERGIGLADSLVEQLESGYRPPSTDNPGRARAATSAESSDVVLAGMPRGQPRLLTAADRQQSVPQVTETGKTVEASTSTGTADNGQARPASIADQQGLFDAQQSPPSGLFASVVDDSDIHANGDHIAVTQAPESLLAVWGGRSTGPLIDNGQADRQQGGLRAAWGDASKAGLAATDDWAPSPGGLLAALSGSPETRAPNLGAVSAVERYDQQSTHVQTFLTPLVAPAQAASRRTGVPAELILAQAALETGWGRHQIHTADGRNSHNLFGIKAGSRWQGPTAEVMTHEYLNGRRTRLQDRFRVYDSYEAAFTDYGRLLSGSRRYAAVSTAPTAEQAARELQAGGYATDPAYADKLIKIMGRFGPMVAEASPSPLIQGF